MESCCFYGFDQQKAFWVRYITKNLLVSWEDRKYDENNIEHRDNTIIKRWRKARLSIGSNKKEEKYIYAFLFYNLFQ